MNSQSTRFRVVLAVTSLLTLGAAAGVTVDRSSLLHGGHLSMSFSRLHHDPMALIDRELDLRPEQRERIAEILSTRQGEVDAAWAEAHARIMAAVSGVVEEIAAELDPEQTERFWELHDQLHGGGVGAP